jgi:hypothetical protein
MVNPMTTFGSICLFMIKGKLFGQLFCFQWPLGNAAGGWLYKVAITKGNGFIRIFFSSCGMTHWFVYDVFYIKANRFSTQTLSNLTLYTLFPNFDRIDSQCLNFNFFQFNHKK